MAKLEYIQTRSDARSSSRGAAKAPAHVTDLDRLGQQVGDARIVVLEEPAEPTAVFRALRTRVTRTLITELGFNLLAVDCDWPDAARVDHYVRHAAYRALTALPFTRGPAQLWRTTEARAAMDWLREYNAPLGLNARIAVHGLDLYCHTRASRLALSHLKDRDDTAAVMARTRLTQRNDAQGDSTPCDRLPLKLGIHECGVLDALAEHLAHMRQAAEHDSARFLDRAQTARLMANARSVYRAMYYGLPDTAHIRTHYMFETLQTLLRYYGPGSKAIMWAKSQAQPDQSSLAALCADAFGDAACLVSADA